MTQQHQAERKPELFIGKGLRFGSPGIRMRKPLCLVDDKDIGCILKP